MNTIFQYGTEKLTVSIALGIATGKIKGILNETAKAKINKAAHSVKEIVAQHKTVYGINTGFGILANTKISDADTITLQHKILQSHSVGVGDPILPELAKLMLITKVQSLAQRV
jgi:histidine ammonia-lyase